MQLVLPKRLQGTPIVDMDAVTLFIECPGHGYYIYVGAVPTVPTVPTDAAPTAMMEDSVKSFLLWRITDQFEDGGLLKKFMDDPDDERRKTVEKSQFIVGRMSAYKHVVFLMNGGYYLAGYALLSDRDTIEYRMRFD